LPEPRVTHYRLEGELEGLIARSFPRPGDDVTLRRIFADSLAGDALGIQARRDGDTIRYGYPVAVMAARRSCPCESSPSAFRSVPTSAGRWSRPCAPRTRAETTSSRPC